MLIYSNHARGYPPTRLAMCADGEDFPLSIFRCPNHAERSDAGRYVYLTPLPWDRYSGGLDADRIAIYEAPDNHDGRGIHVLFDDGRVEWFEGDAATTMLQKAAATPAR